MVRASATAATTADGPTVRRPGRPRSVEADRAILAATLRRIGEDGLAGLSIEAVAADAGVAKTTVYRRWPHKVALVIDALDSLNEPLPPGRPEMSVRDELVELIDTLRRRYERSPAGDLMQRVMAEAKASPEVAEQYFAKVVEPRRERIRQTLRRGVASGELRADLDVDLALHLLTGPMLNRTILHPRPEGISPDFAAQVVDAVIGGIGARGH
jgi:AcrR family transcriptional regulator